MSAIHQQPSTKLTHRRILSIAVPVMLSSVSTPLLGLVDTGVMGQIPDPAYIGAVAVGSLVFTFVFWAFGFLRMGTTGLTAQAVGAGDATEIRAALGRALLVAVLIGAALIALQWPIREIAFALLDGSTQVELLSRQYFDIRIWAAPATLINYAVLGWFIGQGRTGLGLAVQLILNLTNAALDALFVMGFGWEVRGIATGTVIAEYLTAIAGLLIAANLLRGIGGHWSRAKILAADQLKHTLAVNRDIMIRTLALITVFVWFMAQGAKQGDVILAANAVLMQFISTSAYFLDGLAVAAEVLVGNAIGARQRQGLTSAVTLTTLWAGGIAALISLVLAWGGPAFIDLLTKDATTRAATRTFLPWAVWAPLAGVWAFQLDGIFVGATFSVQMRKAMLAATVIFLAAWWLLTPYGNHGLWAALFVHYGARIASLLFYYPALVRSVPGKAQFLTNPIPD